jgi:hypothetical protein
MKSLDPRRAGRLPSTTPVDPRRATRSLGTWKTADDFAVGFRIVRVCFALAFMGPSFTP